MTRVASLAALALATLVATSAPGIVRPTADVSTVRVVAILEAPALAYAPAGAALVAAEQRTFLRELAWTVPDATVRWRYRLVANGFAVDVPPGEVARIRTLPGVKDVYASARYVGQLDSSPGQIGAPALWGPGLATAGQGVKIGIIDSGVDPGHRFFAPAGYSMPAGFPRGQTRFTNAKIVVARAFPPPGAATREAGLAFDPEDSSHGTHVAGIAAGNARTDAGSRTVSGVAPGAYIGNYKVLVRTDSGLSPNGNAPEIVAAIEAAVADGMDVINLSLGEPEIEPTRDVVALALDAAAAAGVVPVVAAGNEYNDAGAGSVASPANSTAAITVGAVEITGSRRVHADFSSVGPTTVSLRLKPDVAAPGVGIVSSLPGGWGGLSGTSMAAPHVAGAAALLVQRHPTWTVAQLKSALVQSGTDAAGEGGNRLTPSFQGGGVVDLTRADRPLLFAEPSSISFGLVQSSAVEESIRLSDAGGGAGLWNVSVEALRSSGGISVDLATSEVQVPGELAFEVRGDERPRNGEYAGYLVLRRGDDVRRIPFWGRRSAARLGGHRVGLIVRPGLYRTTTKGRPARVVRYRYPENPRGMGVTTVLAGPERVIRYRLTRRVANLGVVVTSRAPNVRVEPRLLSGYDESLLTGIAGLPVAHNPYLDGFRTPVLAAGVLSPRAGRDYVIVFDSATRAGAGRFTYRFWVNDVTPPRLQVPTRVVRAGSPLRVRATDAGSGIYAPSLVVSVDGARADARIRNGVVLVATSGLARGSHRLRVRLSDVQETKNTENVSRILPNTRTLTTTFRVR
jgi:subtilisin family serine protease